MSLNELRAMRKRWRIEQCSSGRRRKKRQEVNCGENTPVFKVYKGGLRKQRRPQRSSVISMPFHNEQSGMRREKRLLRDPTCKKAVFMEVGAELRQQGSKG